jgi:uncharacterized membrane protein
MTGYFWLKTLHIISATVLFGTGLGTAFHMWLAHLTRDARIVAAAARSTVRADFLFTTPAVIVQPVTGALLIDAAGFSPDAPWLVAVYALYAVAGACWLPVVWLQIRARDLASEAAAAGGPLPPGYHACMRAWFVLGWPAFGAVLVIFWLMTAKPALW